jgi:hypothetical protein
MTYSHISVEHLYINFFPLIYEKREIFNTESTFIRCHQFSWFLQNVMIHGGMGSCISWFLQNVMIHGGMGSYISWFLQNVMIHGGMGSYISWFQTLQATINGEIVCRLSKQRNTRKA